MSNILLNADSYKASHYVQYPANTTVVSSYIESRGGMFEQTLFFGLQAFIKQTLLKPFTSPYSGLKPPPLGGQIYL